MSNWQPFQWLPQNLKEDVMSCVEDNWLETAEVDFQSTLDNLLTDLDGEIKHHIFARLQKKVKLFQILDKLTLSLTINRVKAEVFAQGNLVFRKDHPIDKVVFILNGKLMKQTSTDGSTSQELRTWDFFGEELLKDIVSGSSTTQSSNKGPLSTTDIKTCTKVEAFILDTSDLQYLVNRSKDNVKMRSDQIFRRKESY